MSFKLSARQCEWEKVNKLIWFTNHILARHILTTITNHTLDQPHTDQINYTIPCEFQRVSDSVAFHRTSEWSCPHIRWERYCDEWYSMVHSNVRNFVVANNAGCSYLVKLILSEPKVLYQCKSLIKNPILGIPGTSEAHLSKSSSGHQWRNWLWKDYPGMDLVFLCSFIDGRIIGCCESSCKRECFLACGSNRPASKLITVLITWWMYHDW